MATVCRGARQILCGTLVILLVSVVWRVAGDSASIDETASKRTERKNELAEFEDVLIDYVNDWVNRNSDDLLREITGTDGRRPKNVREQPNARLSELDRTLIKGMARAIGTVIDAVGNSTSSGMSRSSETGRLFFFKGVKKLLWPMMIGLQVVKTVLMVLFLPSIIGSLGKIVGKGLSSVSGLSHPVQTVDDLDFKDTTSYNAEHDFGMHDDGGYLPADNHPAGTSYTLMYDPMTPNGGGSQGNGNGPLSRLGFGGGRVTYVNSAMEQAKRRQQAKNDFKIFHDIPNSSLLLTNYDPFYSPLLSRLDAVFAQMGLSSKEERCREKLVCLMYANPAKYAPYSNLISAQLSRELDELRKPTHDNPDILRFFKYMRSAKDGQDGVNCEAHYKDCTSYKDLSNPAMVTTFNDINKLVHARKL